MSDQTKQLPIRFPADVKTWLVAQAAHNGSSQNSEVIRAIRERMDRAATDTPNT
jgi:predicted HicB family RNase H-like nuclease